MGNGISIHEQSGDTRWWTGYCRQEWRSQRSRQLDEVLGLQRPALRRGQSFASLEEIVRKLTQDPIPLLAAEGDDNNDLKAAIAKLSSGSILHTEKRAIERLLAQRYEDALAIATAAAKEQAGLEGLGGASDVLHQVLVVFRQNNLPTELDRSGAEEPAEWRVRLHAQRRRAFLVVRSLVRLKREVKRLGTPIADLGWLLPVAAQERWGELKALAARYRQLEEALQDTEVAVSQLAQLREAHGKVMTSRNTEGGRASPQRTPRGGPGRMTPGQGTAGRAVSESGAINSRGKPRTALTADPPPPPVAGVRGGRRVGSGPDSSSSGGGGGNGSAPVVMRLPSPGAAAIGGGGGAAAVVAAAAAAGSRAPLNGKKPSVDGGVNGGGSGGAAGPLVPTLLAQRSGSSSVNGVGVGASGAALSGLYNVRLSVSGGSVSGALATFGSGGGVGAGILAGSPSLTSPGSGAPVARLSTPGTGQGPSPVPGPAGAAPTLSPKLLQRDPTPTRTGPPGSGMGLARPGFFTSDGSPPQPPSQPHTPLPRVAQFLDLTTFNPNAAHHYSVPFEPEVNNSPAFHSAPTSLLLPGPPDTAGTAPSPAAGFGVGAVGGGGNFGGFSAQRRLLLDGFAAANGAVANGNGVARSGGGGRSVEPSPPSAPPPSSGARRPLGPLSHSSPAPLQGAPSGGAAANAAAGGGGGGGSTFTPSTLASVLRPAGPGGSIAVGAGGAADGGGPSLPVLIQDGESLEQALARFKLLSEECRNAMVDTARQFRGVLDLCNSSWPDQRWWLAAHTQEEAALDEWTTTDEFVVHRADIVRCLKVGAVAFQFMCAAASDEPLVGPSGTRFDLWTSDPWEVAADLAPDKLSDAQGAPQRRVGLPVGVRVLQQLANSVAEAAGPQALDSLPIILHISERQREIIAADMLQYGIYRRLRKSLFVVVQSSQPVMRYSARANAYLPDPDQPEYMPGTGFSMLQLLWPGHALFMNESGELERLPHSLMQELRNRATEWFVSRSCLDLSLLQEDGALDVRSLSHVSYMWNTPHLRYSVVVEAASTYVKHRDMILQHGSVLLCRKPKVSGMVVGRLDGAVRVDRYGGPAKPQLPVVELLTCELNSDHMQHELAQIATARATATSVGIGRYVFRFEVLSGLLTGPTALRPKLLAVADVRALRAVAPAVLRRRSSMVGSAADDHAAGLAALMGTTAAMFPFPTPGFAGQPGLSESQLAFAASQGLDTLLLRVHLSMTDLTMHHAAKVVALKAHRPPIFVRGPQDGARLVEVLTASDSDLGCAAERLAAKLPSFARQQKPGQNILVFVQDNSVSLTATNVAAGLVRRERGDRIHLVTVVATEAQRGEGAGLLERLLKAFRTHVDVVTHVMSQEGRGLLECLADVVSQQRCELLVVGSSSITAVAAVAPRNAPLVLPGMSLTRASGTGLGGTSAGRGGAGGGAGGGGGGDDSTSEMLLSSVALSILRTFSLPAILVTANTRTYLKRHGADAVVNGGRPARHPVGGVGGSSSGRLVAMAVVERHGRPMMHHLTRFLLEPSLRQDALTLTQVLPPGLAPGNAGYDPGSIQCVALKTLMANFEAIAAANDFHTPSKVYTQGEWYNALCIAARDHGAQLLAVQLAPGATRSLPPALLQLIRSAPCPVLVYPERGVVPGGSELGKEASA